MSPNVSKNVAVTAKRILGGESKATAPGEKICEFLCKTMQESAKSKNLPALEYKRNKVTSSSSSCIVLYVLLLLRSAENPHEC